MNLAFSIFTVLSPFLAVYLSYILTVRKSRKDIDLEFERALNLVLADLLATWFYLSRLRIIDNLTSTQFVKSAFPTKHIPGIILNSGLIKPADFSKLGASIEELKKYDAVLYYKLEGLGENIEIINNTYILPILHSQSRNGNFTSIPLNRFIPETIESIESNIDRICEMFDKRTRTEIREITCKTVDEETKELIDELEGNYFQILAPLINDGAPVSMEEFKAFLKTQDFSDFLNQQLKLMETQDVGAFITQLIENPDSIEEEPVTKNH